MPQGQTYKAYNGTLAIKRTSSNTEEFTYYFSGRCYLIQAHATQITNFSPSQLVSVSFARTCFITVQ
ncbi:hypothetical protein B0A58_12010 [Flavobacterium branchiophilum NBRC 15030 = ATCC 35035]|nr:hypothetical protein B0A58_12010 [Flavobacterium branchiophilum NBRC 15030 = ATCC 35035]